MSERTKEEYEAIVKAAINVRDARGHIAEWSPALNELERVLRPNPRRPTLEELVKSHCGGVTFEGGVKAVVLHYIQSALDRYSADEGSYSSLDYMEDDLQYYKGE